ncbi:MAG: acyl-ACP desaturase [Acidimicrobiia bacterium]|nr:acyl-ACP desaturase [Acidimicrobiia bacterium]
MSDLLRELEPTVAALLDRHLHASKEWFPHEVVPWDRGRDFDPAQPWDPDEHPVPDAVRSALFVNLLTEDNLPYYFSTINRLFGADGAWGTWARRWTAEEGRHSIAIRDYLTVTRMLDPCGLERARMHQVSSGVVPEPDDPIDGLAYVALQELATRIAHRATGRLLDDPAGYEVMARVATDENHHFLFYRDLVSAALELDPSATVAAIERQVLAFEMPGTGILGFDDHARAIARAGIYDLQVHHDQILVPVVLRHWDVASLEGLDADGEAARERLIRRIDRIGRAGSHLAERWARDREAVATPA